LTQAWSDLNALGITDVGSFQLIVTAQYQIENYIVAATSSNVSFTVTDVAPAATLMLSTTSVPQGSPPGSITVTIPTSSYSDPASSDAASSATVSYDFTNSGHFDRTGAAVGAAFAVPATGLAPGIYNVRAVVPDANGSSTTLYAAYTVTAVSVAPTPPTLSHDAVKTVAEGDPSSLTVHLSGGTTPVTSYEIAWGDGT